MKGVNFNSEERHPIMTMKHLFNISVFHLPDELKAAREFVKDPANRTDGLEILTGYDPIPKPMAECMIGVHLPYATDWYGPFTGKRQVPESKQQEFARWNSYGKDRKEIVENIRIMMKCAGDLNPAYGVFHAASGNYDEITGVEFTDDPDSVVRAMCEMLNEACSVFPGGKPPLRLVFENTWCPGLMMQDNRGLDILENKLEFDNWGICLDTGHLLVSMGSVHSEAEALEMLNACVDRYSSDMKDRITNMHLHVNTTADYMRSFRKPDTTGMSAEERILFAHHHIGTMDAHQPFTDPGVKDLVDRLAPDYLIHEMGSITSEGQMRQHRIQRSLFP